MASLVAQMVKCLSAMQETQVQSWVGKMPWRMKWQPTAVLLPGKSHGQRSLVGYSPWGHKESDMTDRLHFTFTSFINGKLLTRVWLFTIPWNVAYQASPSMECSRQEYRSGLPFPSPGDLPNPGIKHRSSTLHADALLSEPPRKHNCQILKTTKISFSRLMNKLWYLKTVKYYLALKSNGLTAIKRHGENLNSYYYGKEAIWKDYILDDFMYIHDILEKAKLWRQLKICDHQKLWGKITGGEWRNLRAVKLVWWYHDGRHMSLQICPKR